MSTIVEVDKVGKDYPFRSGRLDTQRIAMW